VSHRERVSLSDRLANPFWSSIDPEAGLLHRATAAETYGDSPAVGKGDFDLVADSLTPDLGPAGRRVTPEVRDPVPDPLEPEAR
jgi:hypothetical protein